MMRVSGNDKLGTCRFNKQNNNKCCMYACHGTVVRGSQPMNISAMSSYVCHIHMQPFSGWAVGVCV